MVFNFQMQILYQVAYAVFDIFPHYKQTLKLSGFIYFSLFKFGGENRVNKIIQNTYTNLPGEIKGQFWGETR